MFENVFLAALTPLRDASAWRHDAQHNDVQHNDIQYKGLICDTHNNITLSLSHFVYPYAERRYAERRYDERH